ncbi:MAG: hypothetical protein AAF646_16290 [Pseudomonadota bacterium]
MPPIAPDALYAALLSPAPPRILDVRVEEDVTALGLYLPRSRRAAHRDRLTEAADVVVCHRGLKLSQGVAARLRAAGTKATFLKGGAVAWAECGLPMLRAGALSASGLYVCASAPFAQAAFLRWMGARFLPPDATLLSVGADQVSAVAERFDALPFRNIGDALALFSTVAEPLQRLATETAEQAPGLARPLRGIARHYGAEEDGQYASFAVFDALLAGEMA